MNAFYSYLTFLIADEYKKSDTESRPDKNGIELLIIQIQDSETTRNPEFIHAALTIFPEALEIHLTTSTFKEFYSKLEYNPKKSEFYHLAKSFYVKKPYDAESLDAAQELLFDIPKEGGGIFITSEQGAVGAVSQSESAYVHRDALFNFKIFFETKKMEDVEEGTKWVKNFYESVQFFDSEGTYQNYPSYNLTDYLKRFYGSNLERLVVIKRKWDPDHYFNSKMSLPINLP